MSKTKGKKTERVEIKVHPCLVVFNNPEEGLVVMLDNKEFETPGIWGIVVADIVQHIANAYAADGMAGTAARQEIIHHLMVELDKPTARANMVDAAWHEDGFTIGEGDEE